LTLLTLTDTLGTVKGRLQPYASSIFAESKVSDNQAVRGHKLTQSDLKRATVAVNIRGDGDVDSVFRVGYVPLLQQFGTLRADDLYIEVPRSSTLRTK